MAELRGHVSELEFDLGRRQSLESEVETLTKLLAKRELELAESNKMVVDAELRRDVDEETCRGLSVELDVRAWDLANARALFRFVESWYLRAELRVAE